MKSKGMQKLSYMYFAIQKSKDMFEFNLKVWLKFKIKRFIACKYNNTLNNM